MKCMVLDIVRIVPFVPVLSCVSCALYACNFRALCACTIVYISCTLACAAPWPILLCTLCACNIVHCAHWPVLPPGCPRSPRHLWLPATGNAALPPPAQRYKFTWFYTDMRLFHATSHILHKLKVHLILHRYAPQFQHRWQCYMHNPAHILPNLQVCPILYITAQFAQTWT